MPKFVPLESNAEDLRLIARVARMYHEQSKKQTDIAKELSLSQARVSRLLNRAVELKIVRTVVSVPNGLYPEIEEALEKKFGLSRAIVVGVDESTNILPALGAATARHLETTIQPTDEIGISSWSESLLAAVRALHPSPSLRAKSVVQMVGGRGNVTAQMTSNAMLEDLSKILRAEAHPMLAPAVMGTAQAKQELINDTALAPIVEHWDSLTVALVGIGALQQSPMLASSGSIQEGDGDLQELAGAGAVGDVCLRYYDRQGKLINGKYNARVMTIDEDTFRKIPRRIGVAGGARKQEAVLACLRGNWITTLVTDYKLAEMLLT